MRLIEDFLARTQQARCYDLKETADVLAKVGTNSLMTASSRSERLGSDCWTGYFILIHLMTYGSGSKVNWHHAW